MPLFLSLLPAAYREGKSVGTWLMSHSSSKSQVLDTVGTLLPCLLFLKLFSPISPIFPSTHHTQLEINPRILSKGMGLPLTEIAKIVGGKGLEGSSGAQVWPR